MQPQLKVRELQNILSAHRVRPRAYSIEGLGADEEQYRLEKSGSLWSVYYYERGNRNDVRSFDKEEEACSFLLDLLLADPTTRL
jgi:hypothetical protein